MSKTPNLDVLGLQMSLIFGKCRLAFFVAFKAKRAFFLAFLIFGRFPPFLPHFYRKSFIFLHKFSQRGITCYISTKIWHFAQVFWLFFHKNPLFWNNLFESQHPGFIDFIPYLMLGVFEGNCRLEMAFWKKSSGHTDHKIDRNLA